MSNATPDTPPLANGRRRTAMLVLAAFLALAALAILAWWLAIGRYRAETDNAYVGGNVVPVSTQVAGMVVAVKADDTDLVEQGQTVVQLDDADAKVALQSAEAALAEAVRSVRGLYSSESQSQAAVAQRVADVQRARHEAERTDAEWRRARDDLARKEALYRDKFISAEALTSVRTALLSAQAANAAARSAVAQAESAVTQAREQKTGAAVLVDNTSVENHPRVLSAAAQVRTAYLALARNTVVAPVRGHVARRAVQVGQRVAAGTTLMSVIPDEQLWVDANFKETDLSDVRIGQPVQLTADLYGEDVEYRGRVAGLASGTGSAFAVLPAQNASGNWIKIVQRVPVRVVLDPAQLSAHPLRIGLSMRVTVDTHERDGVVLANAARKNAGYATPVFDARVREADSLIARIIAANRA
ncbi:MAG: HlyD family efflux transporter periplasmic adaptor subunit, partial [Zoogloea sp.]|nr:HlyD family efflux transporter periplasmic adaptor subunit [Zoogloea sp.]